MSLVSIVLKGTIKKTKYESTCHVSKKISASYCKQKCVMSLQHRELLTLLTNNQELKSNSLGPFVVSLCSSAFSLVNPHVITKVARIHHFRHIEQLNGLTPV